MLLLPLVPTRRPQGSISSPLPRPERSGTSGCTAAWHLGGTGSPPSTPSPQQASTGPLAGPQSPRTLPLRSQAGFRCTWRDPARCPAAQEFDAVIAAAALMIALVVWAALSGARLVVRGLLVLAFLPYYLRRR